MLVLLPLFAAVFEIIYYFSGPSLNGTQIANLSSTTTTRMPVLLSNGRTDSNTEKEIRVSQGRFFNGKSRNTKPILKNKQETAITPSGKPYEHVTTVPRFDITNIAMTEEIQTTEQFLNYLTTTENTESVTEVQTGNEMPSLITAMPNQPTNFPSKEGEQLSKIISQQGRSFIKPSELRKQEDQDQELLTKLDLFQGEQSTMELIESTTLAPLEEQLMTSQAASDQIEMLKSAQVEDVTFETGIQNYIESSTKEEPVETTDTSLDAHEEQRMKGQVLQLDPSDDVANQADLKSVQFEDVTFETGTERNIESSTKSSGLVESTILNPQEEQLMKEQSGTNQTDLESVQVQDTIAHTEVGNNIEQFIAEDEDGPIKSTASTVNPTFKLEERRKPSHTLFKDLVEGHLYGIQNNNNGLYLTVTDNKLMDTNDWNAAYTTWWQNTENQKWTLHFHHNGLIELISNTSVRNTITTGENGQNRRWKLVIHNDDPFLFQLVDEDGKECVGPSGELQSDCNDAFLWGFVSDEELEHATMNSTKEPFYTEMTTETF